MNQRTHAPAKCAYITGRFPAISHTFIAREIDSLRELGWEVTPFAVQHAPAGEPMGEDGPRWRAETQALRPFSLADVLAVGSTLLRHPGATSRLIARSIGRGESTLRSRVWHFAYAIEAIKLWRLCAKRGLRHIHSHFASAPSDIARLAVELGNLIDGPGQWKWTFSMHGPTEFADMRHFALRSKTAEADAVACIGDFCRSQLVQFVSAAERDKLRIVRCGIPLDRPEFVMRSPRAIRPDPVILNIGRFVPEKNHVTLVQAIADLRATGVEARLLLVGHGALQAEMEIEAERLGVLPFIEFVGALDNPWSDARVRNADIFCSSSVAEGIPVVLMEAMAVGMPVIATNIAGVAELVRPEETGELILPGQAVFISRAVSRLMADPERTQRLVSQARTLIETEFESKLNARRLTDVFRDMLDEVPEAR